MLVESEGKMSTRSIYKLNFGKTKVIIYRHWDGYIAVGGKDFASLLNHYQKGEDLIKGMLNRQRGIYVSDIDQPLYSLEYTDDIGQEYEYIVKLPTFEANNKMVVEVKERKIEHNPLAKPGEQYTDRWHTIYKKSGAREDVVKDFLNYCTEEETKADNAYRARLAGANA